MKENQLGQSVYTEYVEETKCPIDQSGPLPDLEFDPISWKNEPFQMSIVEHLGIDGEDFYKRTQFLVLFLHIEILTEKMKEAGHPEAKLWRARLAFTHNGILSSSVEQLQTCALECFSEYLKEYRARGQLIKEGDQEAKKAYTRGLMLVLVEHSYALIQFWKYEECEAALAEAF